ncbi:vesicular glutamate transporter 1 isoform X2 [Tribolium madens]|uniref:vesicular glutamate transporter 1 isoform X2 n=1 Tax=Tribolium madens TaxID=41895 RepID=UPI001CF7319D|nr:vesicular glutamate transporter 1 isoform X2 [Tribolium madens]
MTFRNVQHDQFGVPVKKGSEGADDVSSPESMPDYDPPPLRHIDKYIRPECPCLSKRATVALFSCLGFIIMFGMRTSMGVVKLQFPNETSTAGVDSAIFWGYFITQIPGGLIAAAYPANKLFGLAIGTSSFLNLFLPSIYFHSNMLIIVKVMQGLVEGVTYPACHGIMRFWAPPLERSRLATLAFSGCYAGVMFSMPISSELVKRLGPLSPFYFYGIFGLIWYLSWLWLVFEKPSYHPAIDPKELYYIENSLGSTNQNYVTPNISNTPWKTFFTSLPCYAIFVANFCRSWNFYLLVLFQVMYFKDAYGVDIEENGFMGALPHLLMTIIVPGGGILADRLRRKGILNTTQVRKLFNCGGFGMEATFFLIMAYSDTVMQGMTALTIGVAFSGFAISGFNVNHLDIAPRYASILMGISNGIGTIAGCICPYVVHLVIDGNRTREQWRYVFILSAMIHYAGIIFYAFFASGELQDWADPRAEEEKQWNQMNEAVPVKAPNQNNGLLQRQLSGKNNYGSVDKPSPPRPQPPQQQPPPSVPFVPSGNPFLSGSNPFRQEQVQPEAQDTYMHGTVFDRTY